MTAAPIWLSNCFCLLFALASIAAVFQRKSNHLFYSGIVCLGALALLGTAYVAGSVPVDWQTHPFLSIGFFPITFHLDILAGVFLALLGIVAVAIALFSPGYLSHLSDRAHAGHYWAALNLFILSMALVVLSGDAITFIVFWELMSLSSLALVAIEHHKKDVQQAALIYLGATRIATGFLAAGFLIMNSLWHSWSFVDWHFDTAASHLPALLIFLGFAIKAGIWPFHIWLPYAHPAAPAPVSSLMSGVMIKVAIYGMIRLLVLGDLNSQSIAYLALFLGTVSAFWGILFALVQHDLKRLLAYCSVENVGLIVMVIAIALLTRRAGLPEVAAIGLAAAIFHCLNHGLFKSLLFLGAGAVDAGAHSRDLDHLGGLAKAMPWTMVCFLIGCASICAIPPLNGFGSKWLIYQGFFQAIWQTHSIIDRALFVFVICVLAGVGGLGLATFTKAMGVTFLGNARTKAAGDAHEGSRGMIVSQVFLAGCCIALGVTVPQVLNVLQPVCDQATHQTTNITTVFSIPLGGIAIALVALVLLVYAIFLNGSRLRKYITWECGFGNLTPRMQVTPDSFSQPLAKIFSPILRYRIVFDISGKDRRHFPERITVEPHMVSILEQRVYLPAVSVIQYLARVMAKIQAGSIHLYLIYLCVTLLILLLLGTRL